MKKMIYSSIFLGQQKNGRIAVATCKETCSYRTPFFKI